MALATGIGAPGFQVLERHCQLARLGSRDTTTGKQAGSAMPFCKSAVLPPSTHTIALCTLLAFQQADCDADSPFTCTPLSLDYHHDPQSSSLLLLLLLLLLMVKLATWSLYYCDIHRLWALPSSTSLAERGLHLGGKMGVKHLFSNPNLVLYISLWYFFSGTTLFLNKYIISFQKGDAMFLGKKDHLIRKLERCLLFPFRCRATILLYNIQFYLPPISVMLRRSL